MKKADVAMIILIASVSILVAYFIAKAILGDVSEQTARVKTAEPITAEVASPDPKVFNTNAINPTVEVIIGGDSAQR